jgi:hypothetical protein
MIKLSLKMKYLFIFLVCLLLISCSENHSEEELLHPLTVSQNGHFILKHGKPFFWLADTAWELFHTLSREEAEIYLETRARQGYNLFQAVVLSEVEAFERPNAYGDFPIVDGDITKINATNGSDYSDSVQYDYFDHVAWIIEKAKEKGLIAGVLPCWGEYVTPRFREQTIQDTIQGYSYGWFIGNRLKEYNDNIVWILGGDRLPDEAANGVEIWRAMAEGITDAVNGEKSQDNTANYGATFMTYHCYPSSSRWFHNDDWIDFHTWGSYHEKKDNDRAFSVAPNDWNLPNPKPTLNSEPAYEFHPVNYNRKAELGIFDDFDVRQAAYWSVFSGSCGHTYGCHPVWRMYREEDGPSTYFQSTWIEALDMPGANQMKYLKQLMLSRPFTERMPVQDVLAGNVYDPTGQLQATRGENYAMVYVPTGKTADIKMGVISGKKVNAWWYNPRNGMVQFTGEFENSGILSFDAPGETVRGNDWVLVLDDINAGFGEPGKALQ